eukprot:Nitzschia sp. Nitz4//scaffold42_size132992//26756//29100//NITZ4_003384-RA/size132992-augustus-gene-0.101-mRNA-1//1//CDS//3329551673//1465//frame0
MSDVCGMTPSKPMKPCKREATDDSYEMNTSMDDGSQCSESVMLSSPPRAPRGAKPRPSGFGARLFPESSESLPLHSDSSVLRSLDLNFELMGESQKDSFNNLDSHQALDTKTPHRSLGNPQRKRVAEYPFLGRDLSFDDVDDNNSHQNSPMDMMMHSPSASPRVYKSPKPLTTGFGPATAAGLSKSPRYRTMDGRTVQSKNPFSPMYAVDSSAVQVSTAPLADSLSFPDSLEDNAGSSDAPPFLRHRLQKRETTSMFQSTFRSTLSEEGFPEKEGRFSFTGSPIKEMDFDHEEHGTPGGMVFAMGASHKVRRRTKLDDAAAAASNAEVPPSYYHKMRPLAPIDTAPQHPPSYYYNRVEDTSPTDVMSFPFSSSPTSPKSSVPPTPAKQRNYRRRPKSNYTPVRKPAVPPTPMPTRRGRGRCDEESDSENDWTMGVPEKSRSRFHSDFDIIGELGNGSFGNVFRAMSRLDGCMYAIKVAHRPAKGAADKARMLHEVYALAALSDQADPATFHIVRYHQAWMEENRLYIQIELCTSTLSQEMNLRSPEIISADRRYKLLREMCLALEFIHKNGMVHLDIKPENIFVKNDQFKLGDFGLVSEISSRDVEEGDSRYMSKELLAGDHEDLTKSDIFSLGITLYEVSLGGIRPLPTNGPEWQSLRAAIFPPLASTPGEMQRIMKLMMDPQWSSRPSASELLKRPQLLSDEQKALLEERNKVVLANMALAEQANRLKGLTPPPKIPGKGMLVRSSTWNGVL